MHITMPAVDSTVRCDHILRVWSSRGPVNVCHTVWMTWADAKAARDAARAKSTQKIEVLRAFGSDLWVLLDENGVATGRVFRRCL